MVPSAPPRDLAPCPSAATQARLIATHTVLGSVPLIPEIRLHMACEAMDLWQATEDDLGRIGLAPPFWAFAWAGGQALARHVLDHRAIVAGQRVLDFATGSGLVAIAAARAGAADVVASDIDPLALRALALNARSNAVAIRGVCGDLIGQDDGWDVVLAGDVFYDRMLAERLLPWLETLAARGARVVVGDPGRAYVPREGLCLLAQHDVPVTRALEDADVKRTSVWQVPAVPLQQGQRHLRK